MTPTLTESTVLVWTLMLDEFHDYFQHVTDTLSETERHRAHRIKHETDQNNYMLSKGFLRLVLSKFTSVAAKDITFQYNPYGKPYYEAADAKTTLMFNLSHSGEMIALALCLNSDVGIDIEARRERKKMDAVIRKYYTDTEQHFLATLNDADKRLAFTRMWTRKEAFFKAVGRGLGFGIDKVSVSGDEDARILDIHKEAYDTSEWQAHHMDHFDETTYIGTVVYQAREKKRLLINPISLNDLIT